MAHLHFLRILPLTITLSLLWLTFVDSTDLELVESTCKQTLYHDLCMESLNAESADEIEDLNSLAVLALKVAHAKAVLTEDLITELVKETSDPFIQQCLSDCSENFMDAIDQIEDSIAALDTKGYHDINAWVTAAMADSDACEEGFLDQPGKRSLLTKENEEFHKLCSNALAITNLLIA